MRLCNSELSEFITDLLGNEEWVKNLSLLKDLEKYMDDEDVLERLMDINHEKKIQISSLY